MSSLLHCSRRLRCKQQRESIIQGTTLKSKYRNIYLGSVLDLISHHPTIQNPRGNKAWLKVLKWSHHTSPRIFVRDFYVGGIFHGAVASPMCICSKASSRGCLPPPTATLGSSRGRIVGESDDVSVDFISAPFADLFLLPQDHEAYHRGWDPFGKQPSNCRFGGKVFGWTAVVDDVEQEGGPLVGDGFNAIQRFGSSS